MFLHSVQFLSVLSIDVDANLLVDGCMSVKGCFQVPKDCRKNKPPNCDYIVTHQIMKDSNQIKIQMYQSKAEFGTYFAMGISKDIWMKSDLVFSCSRSDYNSPKVHWNEDNTYYHATIKEKILVEGSNTAAYHDGSLMCEFFVPQNLTFTPFRSHTKHFDTAHTQHFDLAQDRKFYLMLAAGKFSNNEMKDHKNGKWVSAKEVNFLGIEDSGKTIY